MRSYIWAGLLASTMLCAGAVAQQAPAPSRAPAQAQNTTPMKHSGEWRASKLIGLNVYNRQNEKIGDINEILLAPSGQVAGVIVGVGGFLGMGEHDVLVKMDQIKFINEPVRTSAAAPATRPAPPANTTGTGAPARTADTAAANRPARTANEKWYPDHAVMNATKEQLKAMPQFKYSNYN